MGGVCSLEDPDDHRHNHSKYEEGEGGRRVAPLNTTKQNSPLAAPNQIIKQSAREIALTKLWNSVVVGELVKNSALSMADETMPVYQCVQQMIKQGSNYCIVKRIDRSDNMSGNLSSNQSNNQTNNQATSQFHHSTNLVSPSALANRKRNKESYVGLFDWRDLTALLVMVCKQARLHGASAQPINQPSSPMCANQTINLGSLLIDKTMIEDSPTKKIAEKIPLISAQSTRMIVQTKDDKVDKEEKEQLSSDQSTDPSNSSSAVHTPQPSVDSNIPSNNQPIIPAPVSPPTQSRVRTINTNIKSSNPDKGAQSSTYQSINPSVQHEPTQTPIQTINPLDEYLHFLDMKRAPTGLVANLSGRNPMQIVNQVCPLLGGVKVLVAANDPINQPVAQKTKRNVWSNRHTDSAEINALSLKQELYRLTIVDKNGLYIGCLTQLAICHWISSKLSQLSIDPTINPSTNQTIKQTNNQAVNLSECCLHDLGLGQRRVMTIGWKAPVLSAITLMHEKSLSALAIINDSNGKLVGTISCSDVKYLFGAPDLLLTLERPVSVFISMLRQSTSYWHVNLASNPPPTATSSSVTVTPRTSLSDTIATLLATKVRRAWVVNEAEQPIGYISITDIIKFFLQQTGSKK